MISDTTACTRFILLTTTDLIAKREAGLERMLASVAAQKETNVSVRLLAQNCDAEALGRLRAGLPAFVQADAIPLRVSLSAARNRLLRTLHDRNVAPHTVIAFPDDDCWYSDDFLPGLASFFARHPSANGRAEGCLAKNLRDRAGNRGISNVVRERDNSMRCDVGVVRSAAACCAPQIAKHATQWRPLARRPAARPGAGRARRAVLRQGYGNIGVFLHGHGGQHPLQAGFALGYEVGGRRQDEARAGGRN